MLFPWLTACVPSFQSTLVSEAFTVNIFTLTLWNILDICCLGNKCDSQPRLVNARTCTNQSQTTGRRLWPIQGRCLWKTRLLDDPVQSCLTDLTPAHQKNRSTFLFNDLCRCCAHRHTRSHTRGISALAFKDAPALYNVHYLICKQHRSRLVILTGAWTLRFSNEKPPLHSWL